MCQLLFHRSSLLFLFLFSVWRRSVCGVECGARVRAHFKPVGKQPPTPSLCVGEPGPRCCAVGQQSGLHAGKIKKKRAHISYFKQKKGLIIELILITK